MKQSCLKVIGAGTVTVICAQYTNDVTFARGTSSLSSGIASLNTDLLHAYNLSYVRNTSHHTNWDQLYPFLPQLEIIIGR